MGAKLMGRVLGVVSLLALFAFADLGAQPAGKVPRVGFLHPGAPPNSSADVLTRSLRELGYVEGRSIAIEFRWAEGRLERLPGLAAELVRLKVDVIVVGSTPAIRAVAQATKTIPVVMTVVADPVASGFVTSLARPGGNLTGLTLISPELSGKRIELLREAAPRLTRLAVLWNPSNPSHGETLKESETRARTLGLHTMPVEARRAEDIDRAFTTIARERASALFVLDDVLLFEERQLIAEMALRNRLPTVFGISGFVEAGGLMAYGAKQSDLYRRAALFVDRILKGAKPANLPIERPTSFELVINLKTAKTLGLTIPDALRLRADRLLEQ
jgi:putative tryptophan/tyrosine transport system substrate-binding protein